ncbi:hypothetical protein [Paenibacillus sp. TH7-28]
MKNLFGLAFVVVIALSMSLTTSLTAFASEDEPEVKSETEKEVSFFNENEAANIALLFVLKNKSEENNWDETTMIDEVYTLYDTDGFVTGYTFNLSTNGSYSGYVTVSSNINEMPIQEFSYESAPIFEENLEAATLKEIKLNDSSKKEDEKNRIIYSGPLQYYLESNGKYYDMDEKQIKNREKIKKSKSEFEMSDEIVRKNQELKNIINGSYMGKSYEGQIDGYVIDDRYAYMEDRYGDYEYEDGISLSGYVGLDMDDYGGDNDCVLVSITAMANWYEEQGYSDIPSTTSAIYRDVLKKAKDNGYTTADGTPPTKIDNIIEDSFSEWGYDGNASNIYLWNFKTFKNEIDDERPALYNLGSGYYENHTISVFGYRIYDVADFLLVKDNWSTSTRYIHFSEMWDEIGSVTTFEIN